MESAINQETAKYITIPLHILNFVEKKDIEDFISKLFQTNNRARFLREYLPNARAGDFDAIFAKQNTLVYNQFDSADSAIRELVANAVDQVNWQDPIGQFGKGGSMGVLAISNRVVAKNSYEGTEKMVIISPKGSTFMVEVLKAGTVDKTGILSDLSNQTGVAIYPNDNFKPKYQNIYNTGLNSETQDLGQTLSEFKFIKGVNITAQFYNQNGQIKNSFAVNDQDTNSYPDLRGQNQPLPEIFVRFYADHFEVINPASESVHPAKFYTYRQSEKIANKNITPKLEIYPEPEPALYILGPSGVVAQKMNIFPKLDDRELVLQSLTSLKLTLPLSLNAARSSADFEQKDLVHNWEKMLVDLNNSTDDKAELLKALNTLVVYIKSLQTNVDANSVLQYSCLAQVVSLAKVTISELRTTNPNFTILPNLRGFSRVQTRISDNESKTIFVDQSFLEIKDLQNIPGSKSLNTGILKKGDNIVLGVDFNYDQDISWEEFTAISKKIQSTPVNAFNDLNLPILTLPELANPREFRQIWLPKELIGVVNERYSELRSLFEYQLLLELHDQGEAENFQHNEALNTALQNLPQLQQEYDQLISLLQIVCSPKTSYESSFSPKVEFKTSDEIKDEVNQKLNKSLTYLTPVSDSDPSKNQKQADKQHTFIELNSRLDLSADMQMLLRNVLDVAYAENYYGLGNLGELDLFSDNTSDFVLTTVKFLDGAVIEIAPYYNVKIEFKIDVYCSINSEVGYLYLTVELNNEQSSYFTDLLGYSDLDGIFFCTNAHQDLLNLTNNVLVPFIKDHQSLKSIFQDGITHIKLSEYKKNIQKYGSQELLENFESNVDELQFEISKVINFAENIKTLQKPNINQLLAGRVPNPEQYSANYVGIITEEDKKTEVWSVLPAQDSNSFILYKDSDGNKSRLQSINLRTSSSNFFISENCLCIDGIVENEVSETDLDPDYISYDGDYEILVLHPTIVPQFLPDKEDIIDTFSTYNYKTNSQIITLRNKEVIVKNVFLDFDYLFYSTQNGFYFFSKELNKDFYSITFLPLQQLLDYPENSGIEIEPIKIFSIDRAKVLKRPFYCDDPNIVLQDNNSETTILDVKGLITDFDAKYSEARDAESKSDYLETIYKPQILEPNITLLAEFFDGLDLPPADRELFLQFLTESMESGSFINETILVDENQIKTYLNLIKEILPEIVQSIKKVNQIDLYKKYPYSLNIDVLENLFFRGTKTPNAILILESYKQLKSKTELIEIVGGQPSQIFYWLYIIFFMATEGFNLYGYDELGDDCFTTENLQRFLYITILASNFHALEPQSEEGQYFVNEALFNPNISKKAYRIIKEIQKSGVITDQDLQNIYDAADGILPNPAAQSYRNYFATPGDAIVKIESELIDNTRVKSLRSLEDYLAQRIEVKTSDPQAEAYLRIKRARDLIDESLDATKMQSRSVTVILQELLQNSIDTLKKQWLKFGQSYQPTINISRSQVTGQGQYLKKDQNYFKFKVRDNGQGVEFIKLFKAFAGNKQKDGDQQGFFTIGANTIFGIEEGIQEIESLYQNPDGTFTEYKLWLNSKLDPETNKLIVEMLHEQERVIYDQNVETFTSISVYKPIESGSSILDILEFDQQVIANTQLIGDQDSNFKPKIFFNDQELNFGGIEICKTNKIQFNDYNIGVNLYSNKPQLGNALYVNNRPMMSIESFLARNGIKKNHWFFKLAATSSCRFNFENTNPKMAKYPLDTARTNFADKEFGTQVFQVFAAQVLSYQASQLILGDNIKLLPDDVLQFGIRSDAFSESKASPASIELSHQVNNLLFSDNTDQDLSTTLSTEAKINEIQTFQLIKFDLPKDLNLPPMTFLEIGREYRRIIKLDTQNQHDQAFLDWIINSALGRHSRLTGSIEASKKYMDNQSFRRFEKDPPNEEELVKLEKFQTATDNILRKLNQSLGTNFKQVHNYSTSDQGITANWKVTGEEIVWFWDKKNLLSILQTKDIKESVDLYVHELTHVIEDKLENVRFGGETDSVTTHGIEFLRLLPALALYAVG